MGQSPKETRPSFQEFSPSEVAQDMFNSSSMELWQHGWNVVYHESSLETQRPMFLLGAGQIAPFS